MESAMRPKRTASKQDWGTPPEVFNELSKLFGGFVIDGAADDKNHLADWWFGPGSPLEVEDALNESETFPFIPIHGNIFVNPPYSKLWPWVLTFERWATHGATVVALLPSRTDTDWFQFCMGSASEIWVCRNRINFMGDSNSPIEGSVVVIWRPEHAQVNPSAYATFRLWNNPKGKRNAVSTISQGEVAGGEGEPERADIRDVPDAGGS